MKNNILKISYAVLMALAVLALVAFMIIHIRAGLDGVNSKLLLAAYVLMIFWAAFRLYGIIKDLLRK
jgi:hypothetical protein